MPIRDKLPPYPDPQRYMLVRTKEGQFWRLKKGLKRPAMLNYQHHFFDRILMLLRSGLKSNGHLDASMLHGLDLQNDYPLRKLLRSGFQWSHEKANHVFSFRIQIPEHNGALLRRNKLMNTYRFIIILVHGNPEAGDDVQVKSVCSQDYPFAGTGTAGECLLELSYTPEPGQWLFCLRAECLEEGKLASHVKSRALQVLDGGRWE